MWCKSELAQVHVSSALSIPKGLIQPLGIAAVQGTLAMPPFCQEHFAGSGPENSLYCGKLLKELIKLNFYGLFALLGYLVISA